MDVKVGLSSNINAYFCNHCNWLHKLLQIYRSKILYITLCARFLSIHNTNKIDKDFTKCSYFSSSHFVKPSKTRFLKYKNLKKIVYKLCLLMTFHSQEDPKVNDNKTKQYVCHCNYTLTRANMINVIH